MANLDSVHFKRQKPAELGASQRRDIRRLTEESIAIDFPHRMGSEVTAMATRADRMRVNPNQAVGGPVLAPNQRYRKLVSLLAFNAANDLIAFLPMADNASSREGTPGLGKLAEIQAKLWLPGAATHRARWAGLCVLSEEARQHIHNTPPDEATIIDGMLLLGSETARTDQPFTAYPYRGENTWISGLGAAGYHYKVGSEQAVQAFLPDTDPVVQETWEIASANELQTRILVKDGINLAMQQASR